MEVAEAAAEAAAAQRHLRGPRSMPCEHQRSPANEPTKWWWPHRNPWMFRFSVMCSAELSAAPAERAPVSSLLLVAPAERSVHACEQLSPATSSERISRALWWARARRSPHAHHDGSHAPLRLSRQPTRGIHTQFMHNMYVVCIVVYMYNTCTCTCCSVVHVHVVLYMYMYMHMYMVHVVHVLPP